MWLSSSCWGVFVVVADAADPRSQGLVAPRPDLYALAVELGTRAAVAIRLWALS
jgi:hypothetical protein